MRILDRKGKNSISLNTDGGREYIALDNKQEREYLKYAAHLLSLDAQLKAAYKLESGAYLFVERIDDQITFNSRDIPDNETRVEIGAFFGGRAAKVFDASQIPKVKQNLFSDKRVALIIIIAVALIGYMVFKNVVTKKVIGHAPETPTPALLSDSEKGKLKIVGSRLAVRKIVEIISSVQPDQYQRIASLSAQIADGPQAVSYTINTTREYLYPEADARSREKGVWAKTTADSGSLERKDIKPVPSEDYGACSLQMLNRGFYVLEIKGGTGCVDLTYEDDAMKVIRALDLIANCNVSLNSMSISTGKGKLDVTLYSK